ncbi:MAG: prepilin peptidase [Acidobacteria bacterium]|nr:prepilin peptidase [Acidobacteriota bacterium]
MRWLLFISILIGALATVEDLYRRRISNRTSIAAFAMGLAAQTALHGLKGAGNALAGTFIGFVVFLIFFLLGGMGAGDIKLMAGFGAVVGAGQILMAALLTAIAGGLLAMSYLLARKLRRKPQNDAAGPEAIPYAPAITLGVLLSFAAR